MPAEVLFCFSRPVGEFRISVSRVFAGELLRSFSAGPPTRIEGDLVERKDHSITVPPAVGDYGKGTLVWQNLNQQVFSFILDSRAGWATAVDSFAITAGKTEANLVTETPQQGAALVHPCEALSVRF